MITERFKSVICKELRLKTDDVVMEDDTKANQVPGWDSLNHINVILALEKDYGVRFKSIEVLKCKNIGDLQNLVNSKIA